ncbi:ABC-type transport system involved in multi-copper enzyme maturation, permease component [Actinomyces bovis]|uniref:ABC-type transport system involved in multi-copper enzyme maturation, permease component n=1 Tax=Actinomyces bovis TaxID=1658 RepID=A0ABY1VLD7_9ACTO|nr:hypothetical protein [Actinomyces bovis]SPT52919.1 ABC-type transport system involved in multi-copper enzyme maturation, permease component [Actinomyces bovis]VEG55077.1 ABC-type transport system involved in multi-copper enzyme maturation, permease component [Actinomyces israelii]
MSAVSVQKSSSTGLWQIVRTDMKAASLKPAIRIAVLIWVLQIVIFAYVIPYILYHTATDAIGLEAAEALRAGLDLSVLGEYVTASVPLYGIPVGVVVGAILVCSDYELKTLGVLLARIPKRWWLGVSRLVTMAVVSLIMALYSFIAAAICSTIFTAIQGTGFGFDFGGTMLGLGATTLGLFSYAVLGSLFGYLTRSILGAVMLGLGWTFGIETLGIGMLAGSSNFFKVLHGFTLTGNIGSLPTALDRTEVLSALSSPGVNALHSGSVALLFIICWLVVCASLGTFLLCRRDVS